MTERTSSLFYYCVHCEKMVRIPNGPYWIDNGAILFCPICGNGTHVELKPEPTESVDLRKKANKTAEE